MASVESIGYFGDERRALRGAWLYDRIVLTGSLVARRLGQGRAGEMAIHRFLDSPSVTVGEIVETLAAGTAARCAGRRIIAVQDTTEINFSGRDLARRGLGPGGDGVGLGFFIHPVIAIDAADQAVVGLLDAQIWTRAQDSYDTPPSPDRAVEDKESMRWINGMVRAVERTADAAQVIVVGDRESDLYPLFARRPARADLVVRAAQDRRLAKGGTLFKSPAAWSVLDRWQVAVPSRGVGDPGRSATVTLRAGTVELRRPQDAAKTDPALVSLTLVDVEETAPPAGAKPIHWRLLTTLPAPDAASAREIVEIYRLRWRIEETFRALKRDGLRLGDVQIQQAERLFKLSAMALGAAIRTIQLVDARDGGPRPATDVADPEILDAAAVIGKTLEGRTPRQQNHYPVGSLAWLAWIVARLGGWNCYYKPPGPKTMRTGWDQLAAMAAGFTLAKTLVLRNV